MNKKILCGALISAAVLLPQAALAAPNDIIGQEKLQIAVEGVVQPAESLVINGRAYLPVRALFEALGTEVDWDGRAVIATETDGTRIIVPLTDDMEGNFAHVRYTEDGENWYQKSVGLAEQLPFVRDGRVYLPVRALAELMNYNVAYTKGADNQARVDIEAIRLDHTDEHGGVYQLNLSTNELTYTYGGSTGVIGVLDLKSLYNPSWYAVDDFTVEHTEGGNYLFKGNGMGSGALTFGYKVSAWMSSGGGDAITCYTSTILPVTLPEPVQVDDTVWLPENGKAVAVNEKTGEVTEYSMSEIHGEASSDICYWTDGRFLLIGSGADFDIYDTKTKKLTDLKTVLAEPLKAQVKAFMQANSTMDEEYLDGFYWDAFGNLLSVDPCVSMTFDKFAAGKLYFTLNCPYWGKDWRTVKQTYPLVYELPV